MNTRHVRILAALALTGGLARGAVAADGDSPWTLSIFGGDSAGISGELRAPRSISLSDLGTFDPALSGAPGTLTLDKLRYDDLFRRRYDTGFELGYAFSDNLQSFGRVSYDNLSGRNLRIGELQIAGLSAVSPLDARFADANNVSLDFGTRYFFSTGTTRAGTSPLPSRRRTTSTEGR